MKKIWKVSIIVIAISLLVWFSMWFFAKPRHLELKQNQSTTLVEPAITTFNFPLYISVSDLEKLINKKLKILLADKTIPFENGKDSLKVKMYRLGNFSVQLQNEKIISSVPLKLEIQIQKHLIGKKSITFLKKKPFIIQLKVHFSSDFQIDEFLKFHTKTKLTKIEWLEEPELKILGIDFNMKRKIDEIISAKTLEINRKFDNLIYKKINLKKPTLKIWNNLQKAILANKTQKDLFVRIQPQNLAVFVNKNSTDSLKLNLVVTSKVYLRFDTLLISKVDFPKKIKLLSVPPSDSMSKINIHFLLPLAKLNQILDEKIAGKTIKIKGIKVKIESISVSNGLKYLNLKVKHSGGINGTSYFKGIPVLSKNKKTISIQDIDFENKIETKVFNSLADMFHEEILKLIQKNIQFKVGQMMDSIPTMAKNVIQKSKFSKKAVVNLNHLKINELKIHLTKSNVELLISAESIFEIAVRKESFKLQ